MKLHLHQVLSRAGLFKTKKEMLEAVLRGEFELDGEVLKSPMYRFNPEKRKVTHKGKPIIVKEEMKYLLVNKPVGYISGELTAEQARNGKKSIYDLIKMEQGLKNTLFCVGRLDEESSGLIIITNDGKLGYKITNPNSGIKKKYYVELENNLSESTENKILKGVRIKVPSDNGLVEHIAECQLKRIDERRLFVTIDEGKKREVRKIFEAVSNKVIKLERVSIGSIKLDNLKPGDYKEVEVGFIKERLY
jgi:pseudouridine synthase